MVFKSIIGATCACLAVISFNVNAAFLEGRLPVTPGGSDYQAYYDPDAKLTWLADADANGRFRTQMLLLNDTKILPNRR